MTKDEMKNRISLALKDPILQQGFEIICKNLETEQKLNAEIKARFVKCNTCTDEMKSKCLMFSENLCEGERCEELVDLMALVNKSDLQKENAELKETVIKMNKVITETFSNLTKAKEYIKLLLMNCVGVYESTGKTIAEIQAEAEQFLKENSTYERIQKAKYNYAD